MLLPFVFEETTSLSSFGKAAGQDHGGTFHHIPQEGDCTGRWERCTQGPYSNIRDGIWSLQNSSNVSAKPGKNSGMELHSSTEPGFLPMYPCIFLLLLTASQLVCGFIQSCALWPRVGFFVAPCNIFWIL